MTECPVCSTPVAESFRFCPQCLNQLRCIECDSALPIGARGCVTCGASIASRNHVAALHEPSDLAIPLNRNHIEYESTSTRSAFKAELTDAAIENMSDAILALMNQRGLPTLQSRQRPNRGDVEVVDAHIKQLPLVSPLEATNYEAIDEAQEADQHTSTIHPHLLQLRDIFLIEGEKYKLQNPQIKATSASDFCRRAGCLLLYAHELMGDEWVARSEVYNLFKECKVENNSRDWLANGEELMRGDNFTLRLSVPGRAVAVETLERIHDPSIEPTWSLSSHAAGRSSRTTRGSESVSDSTKVKSGRKVASQEMERWILSWKTQYGHVPAHDLLSGKSPWEIAIAGMRAIEISSGQLDMNISREQIAQFATEAFAIKRAGRSYERSLKEHKNARTLVLHVTGTVFRLNPKGRKAADGLLELGEVALIVPSGVSHSGSDSGTSEHAIE